MYSIFLSVQRLLKIDRIRIDNAVFLLHYRVTRVLLLTCSALVSSKQYFGDPIDCLADGGVDDGRAIDLFCWIQSTYTVPSTAAHPGGVAPHHGPHHTVRHHKYYQWVALVLFLQGGMFYVPRFLWKVWEGRRVEGLVGELGRPLVRADLKEARMALAADYFCRNLHGHGLYASQFFLCELLNFANAVGQFFLTESFLGEGFTNYGPDVVRQGELDADPKDVMFPKVAKCTFHKFGPSGTIMRLDAICILPLNILNQKIYLFLWFWLLFLALVTGCAILYRLATLCRKFRHVLLWKRSRLVSSKQMESVTKRCHVGDWFILYMIAKNMDPFMFKDFIDDLSPKLNKKEKCS